MGFHLGLPHGMMGPMHDDQGLALVTTTRPARTRTAARAIAACAAIALCVPGAALAGNGDAAVAKGDAVPGEVVVTYKGGDTDLVRVDGSIDSAVSTLKTRNDVAYAEPNYRVYAAGNGQDWSSDPLVANGASWNLYGNQGRPRNRFGSGAVLAWAAGITGNRNVYVAVLDEGVQVTHPDLAANVWTNNRERPGDGIDNDRNGFVDDVNGWDFINDDGSLYDGTTGQGLSEVDMHGTHVAGIIGAVGDNGIGTSGVAQDVGIIPVKMLDYYEGGTVAQAVAAIDYMVALKTRRGINIVAANASWESAEESRALQAAIRRAGNAGILFVTIAGNGDDNDQALDVDSSPVYPAAHTCPQRVRRVDYDCILTVTAIDEDGARPDWANYGRETVDLGAPGVDILSLAPDFILATDSGTSMAAPHVSGAIALYASRYPNATPATIREAVMDSAKRTPSLRRTTVSGGRLDIAELLNL